MEKGLADQIRDVVFCSGLSQAELGRITGIPQPMIGRFMNGASITLETLDKLCKAGLVDVSVHHGPPLPVLRQRQHDNEDGTPRSSR